MGRDAGGEGERERERAYDRSVQPAARAWSASRKGLGHSSRGSSGRPTRAHGLPTGQPLARHFRHALMLSKWTLLLHLPLVLFTARLISKSLRPLHLLSLGCQIDVSRSLAFRCGHTRMPNSRATIATGLSHSLGIQHSSHRHSLVQSCASACGFAGSAAADCSAPTIPIVRREDESDPAAAGQLSDEPARVCGSAGLPGSRVSGNPTGSS